MEPGILTLCVKNKQVELFFQFRMLNIKAIQQG